MDQQLAFASCLARSGMTAVHFAFLDLASREQGVTQGEIMAQLGMSAGGVSESASALEYRKLLHRERVEEDYRKVIYYATAAGKNAVGLVRNSLTTNE